MKKIFVLTAMVIIVILFSNCHSSKKAASASVPKLTYESNVQTLIAANCSPCHIPSKGGNKKALDTYASLSANIDDVIHRIELQPTDKGFMPFKHPRLDDATIAVFKKWKADGMIEK